MEGFFPTFFSTYVQSSTTQFWEKYVLNITDGLVEPGDLGGFKYDLPLALLLSWLVVFLCLMKGVKSSGKVKNLTVLVHLFAIFASKISQVVYFTATFPYVILIALLVRGCLLDGAVDGIKFLFIPKWEKLLHLEPWYGIVMHSGVLAILSHFSLSQAQGC